MAGPHGRAQDRRVDRPARRGVGGGAGGAGHRAARAPARRSSSCATRPRTCRCSSPRRSGCARRRCRRSAEGARVIVHGKPSFFLGRGTLSLRVDEIRAVGLGELLARIERLRAAAGRGGAVRRRPASAGSPFLPRLHRADHRARVGRRARRPVERHGAAGRPCASGSSTRPTQGALAVPQIIDALGALDRDPDVDVIVLARGGGSVEDLLPFSDETLCRAVAACRTPVVSRDRARARHPAGRPRRRPALLDAHRRRPPAGARPRARRRRRVAGLRDRARRALAGWVDREERLLAALRAPAGAGRPAARSRARGTSTSAAARRRPVVRRARPGPARRATSRTSAPGWPPWVRPRRWRGGTRSCSGADRATRSGRRRCRCCGPPPRHRRDRLRVRVADGAVGAGARVETTRRDPPDPHAPTSARWATSRPATSSPTSCARWRPAALGLDESVALWERGEALARRCEEQLAGRPGPREAARSAPTAAARSSRLAGQRRAGPAPRPAAAASPCGARRGPAAVDQQPDGRSERRRSDRLAGSASV